MNYHKVKSLKTLLHFVHFLTTVVLPKASIMQSLLICQNMKHFLYIYIYMYTRMLNVNSGILPYTIY